MEEQATASASLLSGARKRARLSQTDLARRAHVGQSVVSAYESGRREPGLSTLTRLVAATGHRLVLGLEPDPEAGPGLPDTPLGRRLRQRRAAVLTTVGRHGASNDRVFGSVARGEEQPGSDVDLLVDLAPDTDFFSLGALDSELSEVPGTRVDVVSSDSLRPRARAEAEAESIPL